MSEDDLRAEWIRAEAMNLGKVLAGGRLSFVEWLRQRDERARTGRGGQV